MSRFIGGAILRRCCSSWEHGAVGQEGTDGHGLAGQDEELRRMTGSDALSLDQELAMQVSLKP